MKDSGNGFFSKLKKLQKTKLEVGVFADAKNNDETPSSYVADYAIANEFGTKNIPERSFIRSTSDEKQDKWQNAMDDAVSRFFTNLKNNGSVEGYLYVVGEKVRRDIIEKIDSNIAPENAPATKKQKLKRGKNRTLIDTGALRQSIEARVKHV